MKDIYVGLNIRNISLKKNKKTYTSKAQVKLSSCTHLLTLSV